MRSLLASTLAAAIVASLAVVATPSHPSRPPLAAVLGRDGPGAAAPGGLEAANAVGAPAVAHRAGGTATEGADHHPTPYTSRLRRRAVEPTFGLTRSGAVIVSATAAANVVSVLRSRDDGATWEDVSPSVAGRQTHRTSFDPYVTVDPATGRVFMADLAPAPGCLQVSSSDDDGASWRTGLTCGWDTVDHQTVFAGKPVSSATVGYPSIVYACANTLLTAECARSLDGGLTWVPTTGRPFGADADPSTGCNGVTDSTSVVGGGGLTGHGVVGPDGAVYLPRVCRQPYLAISRDEGATWTHVRVSDLGWHGWHDGSVAVDAENTIYYAWHASDRLPYLVYSRDGGATWSDPMMIAAPGVTESNLLTIDVGAPGKVAAAYYGSANSPATAPPGRGVVPDPACGVAACPDPPEYRSVTWNGYITITADLFAGTPTFYSAAVSPTPLMTGSCGPGRCKAAYDFIDVNIDRGGRPWASFVNGCAGGPCDDALGEGLMARLDDAPNLRSP